MENRLMGKGNKKSLILDTLSRFYFSHTKSEKHYGIQ